MTRSVALSGHFLSRPWTGSGQYSIRLLEWLNRLDSSGNYVSFPGGEGSFLDKIAFEQFRFPRLGRGFGLLHVPYLGPPLRAPKPVVVTVHDLIMLALPEHRGPLLYRLYIKLALASAKRAALLLADSESTSRDIQRFTGIPASRIRVIPLGHDEQFSNDPGMSAVEDFRRRNNLPAEFALYLGAFDDRKNVPLLFRAVQAAGGDWPLAIAGTPPPPRPPLYPDVKAAAKPLGERVRWLGRVSEEDKPLLYRAASVFVFPSRYEGFGLPPLEAMASGTPVIGADATSVAEVVGDAGILAPPDDEAALAHALRRLMTEPAERQRYAELGLECARRFTWEQTARLTLDAYDEALSGGARP